MHRRRLLAGVLVLAVAGCSAQESGDPLARSGAAPTNSGPIVTAPAGPASSPIADTPTTDSPDRSATTDAPVEPTPTSPAPPSTSAARIDPPVDAEAFASLLSTEYATMTDPSGDAEARSASGERFQLVLRALADRPELDDAVLTAADPDARATIERLVRAREFLQARSATTPGPPPPTEVPAWTIVEPEPVETLLAHYAEAERLTGIAWYWLAAIHLQETRMGRIEGVSSAGAVGPMQFLPTTWASCCTGDPTVTRDAIVGAATYLAQSGGPEDMAAALYQYNPNDGYVAVVTAYAESLRDDPELYPGYHGFQVFFGSSAGTIRLPIGYSEPVPVDAAAYLEANPQHAA